MVRKMNKLVLFFIIIIQTVSCQKMKENTLPEFRVQVSSPENKYIVEFVSDEIKTLEGVKAGLPFGGSSGKWGDSGKGFTEQHGTPIGADIIYFSPYEDTFYHLKADFPLDKIKNLTERAYAQADIEDYSKPIEEYKNLGRGQKFGNYVNPYDSFDNLVFGFAPKGMVVVWLRFGYVQIELGRYQSTIIKDDAKAASIMFSKTITVSREQIRQKRFIPDASPQLWDNYRTRYHWIPILVSENPNFKAFEIRTEYYNGERDVILKPWINNPPMRGRAIPKEISFFWETGKGEAFEGRAFFNWEKTNEAFKTVGKDFKLEFKIKQDNTAFEILANGQPFRTDSLRLYKSERKFKGSYE